MNFKKIALNLLIGCCLLFSSFVSAKDYAIEIIIFVNKDGLHQTAEQFSVNQIIPVPENGLNIFNKDGLIALEETLESKELEENI